MKPIAASPPGVCNSHPLCENNNLLADRRVEIDQQRTREA